MTNQERAEKIVTALEEFHLARHSLKVEKVTSQLDEAVAIESRKMQEISELRIQQAVREASCTWDDTYNQGFASAREKAAGIVNDKAVDLRFLSKSCESYDESKRLDKLAERIRAMSPTDEPGVSPMEADK